MTPTNLVDLEVADSSRLPWQILSVKQIGAEIPFKSLLADPDTGMQVMLLRYDAGFTNTWHTHPCAHGMYVLDGVLVTHQGEYGPGSFVWFPEGGWMEHGATPDNDVTFLFITNKPFSICYESDPDHPYPMTQV
ncbi:cupin domain-containing protein [Gordonia sp. ABSL11-1]|uniref:cupin domain-containing protein n=1 Tax=Gordonia sp. ABSL11-1 TaxID=3053924 RepID=UPI0025731D77|nr:cupin domain-containing protein [Gordonia sp. ABSL11-1]MDL9947115.1 cupin domain-containing protein [Gordonia sp. ABSL11-1]